MTDDNRLTVDAEIDVDTCRLYGSIDEAIAYLKEMRSKYGHFEGFGLEERWTGYEDMEMVFSYTRDETDDEMNYRLNLEREEERRRREAQELKESREREHDLRELERLRGKLGL